MLTKIDFPGVLKGLGKLSASRSPHRFDSSITTPTPPTLVKFCLSFVNIVVGFAHQCVLAESYVYDNQRCNETADQTVPARAAQCIRD